MNGNAHTIQCIATGQNEYRHVCSCRWRSSEISVNSVGGFDGVEQAELERARHLSAASVADVIQELEGLFAAAKRRAHGRAPGAR